VAVPNLVLLPGGVAAVDLVGFAPVLLLAALPVLGVPAAFALGRLVGGTAVPEGPAVPSAADRRELLRAVGPPTLVLLSSTFAGGALLTFLPQVTTPAVAGTALLVMGATAAASRFGAGYLADAGPGGGHRWLAPLLLAAAAGTAACGWGARDDAAVGWILLGALLCGTGYGALQNLTLVAAFRRAGPGRVDETSTVWNIGFDGGTALGSVMVGVLAGLWGFPLAFGVAAVACVLAVAATLPGRPAPA
jgi:hypothetical protein